MFLEKNTPIFIVNGLHGSDFMCLATATVATGMPPKTLNTKGGVYHEGYVLCKDFKVSTLVLDYLTLICLLIQVAPIINIDVMLGLRWCYRLQQWRRIAKKGKGLGSDVIPDTFHIPTVRTQKNGEEIEILDAEIVRSDNPPHDSIVTVGAMNNLKVTMTLLVIAYAIRGTTHMQYLFTETRQRLGLG
jgi:hypothetical protein